MLYAPYYRAFSVLSRYSMVRDLTWLDLWCSFDDCRICFVFHIVILESVIMQYSCVHLTYSDANSLSIMIPNINPTSLQIIPPPPPPRAKKNKFLTTPPPKSKWVPANCDRRIYDGIYDDNFWKNLSWGSWNWKYLKYVDPIKSYAVYWCLHFPPFCF